MCLLPLQDQEPARGLPLLLLIMVGGCRYIPSAGPECHPLLLFQERSWRSSTLIHIAVLTTAGRPSPPYRSTAVVTTPERSVSHCCNLGSLLYGEQLPGYYQRGHIQENLSSKTVLLNIKHVLSQDRWSLVTMPEVC